MQNNIDSGRELNKTIEKKRRIKSMFKNLIASISIIVRKVMGKYPTDIKNSGDYIEEEYIFDDGSNPFES